MQAVERCHPRSSAQALNTRKRLFGQVIFVESVRLRGYFIAEAFGYIKTIPLPCSGGSGSFG
jgi:hypothetical protein